ncbi:RNA polymerase II mediator complex component [Colletotrichum plurivorum]|uniref:RNA polymerase II mediator complex component n=1 Tax=Colletotrichum plurivorum TaxID=2175906 RepID=A0A8H6N8A9_9PEZI|nr:RNA polymerase II mediator complex component [Colletotrichum plurivorum]
MWPLHLLIFLAFSASVNADPISQLQLHRHRYKQLWFAMGRRSKQKSCFPCVEAKRRCDRSLPACSRCLEREVDCAYPPVRRPPLPPPPDRPLGEGLQIAPNRDLDAAWPGVQGNLSDFVLQGPDMDAFVDSLFTSDALGDNSAFAPQPTCLSMIDYNNSASSSSSTEPLNWFLTPPSWHIAHHYQPPGSMPPAAVLSNFIRGLQSWLVRFLRKGHNPFIHRRLYTEATLPRCVQDAFAAVALSQSTTPENEHLVDAASSNYLMDLLAAAPPLTTRAHLARTQALLVHLLLSLFSPSIPRRARAEGLVSTLRVWARELWDSAVLYATAVRAGALSAARDAIATPEDGDDAEDDPVQRLYRAFVLSESVRRTFLIASIATGVYGSLKVAWSETCGGDVCVTARAALWDAESAARWEAVAREGDPLCLHSLHGYLLVERGVPAGEVDEFLRLLFTVMWGLEKVERWVVSTGDTVSVMY